MNEALNEKYAYVYDRSRERKKREKYEIGISAVRGGNIVGEHEVIFAGQDEVIEFKHTAYSKAVLDVYKRQELYFVFTRFCDRL